MKVEGYLMIIMGICWMKGGLKRGVMSIRSVSPGGGRWFQVAHALIFTHLCHSTNTARMNPISSRFLGSRPTSILSSCTKSTWSTTRRTFATSRPTLNNPPPSSKDPNHPQLWYHPLPQTFPPRIALSFLPHPPLEGSKTILGYLPADSAAGLRDFKEEPRFL